LVELATDAETQALADATRAVTPAGLAAAAVAAATADRLMRRDAAGRAQVAAPSVAADIARKDTVDAVQASADGHAALTNPHGATSAATASRLVLRDAAGRAQVAAPSVAADIARKDTVDGHAAATTGVHGVGASTVESAAGAQAKVDAHANQTAAHGATVGATADRLVLRDAAGRAKIAAPAVSSDIASKGYVDGVKSVAGNGFMAFPGGIVMQWGEASVSAGASVAITLPTAFPTGPLWAQAGLKSSVNSDSNMSVVSLSASQITVRNGTSATQTITWLAIGY
jgi:hypothetical protein